MSLILKNNIINILYLIKTLPNLNSSKQFPLLVTERYCRRVRVTPSFRRTLVMSDIHDGWLHPQ